MNILYITTHLNVGGITSYLLTLAAGMHQRGHSVWIASSGGTAVGRFAQAGIPCLTIPIRTKAALDPRVAVSALMLKRLVRSNRMACIHAQTRVTQTVASLLSQQTGVPYLSTCHGFFQNRWLRRRFPCWGRRVIAVSDQVRRHLIDDFGVDEGRIRLIPNGIDTEYFAPFDASRKNEAKKSFGCADSPVVGILARLSPVKGHRYLIRAMKLLVERLPQVKLLIVGEGGERRKLAALAEALGLGQQTVFVPSIADTRLALAAMDVFAMPSLAEGLGLSLMEAMASEVPVVGSSVGGIVSLIQDGRTGLLVPPGEPENLAASLMYVLTHRFEAEAWGKRGRALIKERFSKEQMIMKTEEVYRECRDARS